MTNKVFLGGTWNKTTWRQELIPLLKAAKIDYFNPIVENWKAECQENEYTQKEICNIHLYVITQEMTGAFSIAEAVDSAWQSNKHCILQVLPEGFSESQIHSFEAVIQLVAKRGGYGGINANLEYTLGMLECFNSYNKKEEVSDQINRYDGI